MPGQALYPARSQGLPSLARALTPHQHIQYVSLPLQPVQNPLPSRLLFLPRAFTKFFLCTITGSMHEGKRPQWLFYICSLPLAHQRTTSTAPSVGSHSWPIIQEGLLSAVKPADHVTVLLLLLGSNRRSTHVIAEGIQSLRALVASLITKLFAS